MYAGKDWCYLKKKCFKLRLKSHLLTGAGFLFARIVIINFRLIWLS